MPWESFFFIIWLNDSNEKAELREDEEEEE